MDLLVKFKEHKFLFNKNIKFEKHKINKINKICIDIEEKDLITVFLIINKSNDIINHIISHYEYDWEEHQNVQSHINFDNDDNDYIIYDMLFHDYSYIINCDNMLIDKIPVNHIKIEIVLKNNVSIGTDIDTDITLVKYYNSNIAFTTLINNRYEFEYDKIKEYFKELNKEVIEYVKSSKM